MASYRSNENWVNMSPQDRNQYLFNQYGFDPRGNNELGVQFQQYAQALYPQVGADLQFMEQLAPQRRQAITNLLSNLGPGGVNADIASYGTQADENAAQAARQASMFGRASGMGDGFTAGQQAGAFGQAAAAKNAFRAQQMSPEARIARAAAMLQAIEGGMNSPAMQMQMGLFGPIEQRHVQNQREVGSGSFGNTLAQIAGMYSSMSGGGFGGGGGGGTGGAGSGQGGDASRPSPNQSPVTSLQNARMGNTVWNDDYHYYSGRRG